MLSASLIFTTLFFPPPVKSPVSSISWWRAERGRSRGALRGLGTQAHRPRSNYSERERTFSLFCEWGISMAAVQWLNYSSILDQHGKKSPAGTSGGPPPPRTIPPTTTHPPPPTAHHPHRLSDLLLPLKDLQMGLVWRIEKQPSQQF